MPKQSIIVARRGGHKGAYPYLSFNEPTLEMTAWPNWSFFAPKAGKSMPKLVDK